MISTAYRHGRYQQLCGPSCGAGHDCARTGEGPHSGGDCLGELYRPVEDALRSLSIPAAVSWGDHDPFFPVSQGERTATAARAQLRVYEGAGHFLPHERPKDVSADILDLVQLTRS